MIVPPLVFMGFHIATYAVVLPTYPENVRTGLIIFGMLQGIVEHYADVFPNMAVMGPLLVPIALGLFGWHYYLASKVLDKTTLYSGLLAYILLLVVAKGMDLGFPKDTAAEQIEANNDEDYTLKHLFLHILIIASFAITAVPAIRKQEAASAKAASAKAK